MMSSFKLLPPVFSFTTKHLNAAKNDKKIQIKENVHLLLFRKTEPQKSNRKHKTKYKIFLEIIVDTFLIVQISSA